MGFALRERSNADRVRFRLRLQRDRAARGVRRLRRARIRSDLATALGAEAPLVVDLTQATFIDSTIVGVLLEGLADCEKRERPLLLLLPDDAAPEVHRLEITGLGALLPVVRSWDEANARVAARGL